MFGTGFRDAFDLEPEIFPVSSQLALAAKEADQTSVKDALWKESRFGPLEQFVRDTLTGPASVQTKLNSPIRSALKLLESVAGTNEEHSRVLAEDETRLADYHEEIRAVFADIRDGYDGHLAEVDNVLLEMERRGVQFLDDNIRMSKLGLLRNRAQFKEEFARQVVHDHERRIETQMDEAVDYLLRKSLGAWNVTLSRFSEARTGPSPASDQFAYNRAEILESIMRRARQRISGYDLHGEARRILENARNAAALFLGTEAMAAGIGVVATLLIVGAGMDVTGGFLASGALAALGLIFLPRQRRRATAEFRERVDALRKDLRAALANQFEEELSDARERMDTLVGPLEEMVVKEKDRIAHSSAEHALLVTEIAEVESQIAALAEQ